MSAGQIIGFSYTRTSSVQLDSSAQVLITALVEVSGRRTFAHIVFVADDEDFRTEKFEIRLVKAAEAEMENETPENLAAFITLRDEAEAHIRRLLPSHLIEDLSLSTGTYANTPFGSENLTLAPLSDWLVDLNIFTKWLKPFSQIVAGTAEVEAAPVVDQSELSLMDGTLMGSGGNVQRVKWKGVQYALKSLSPNGNDFHQENEMELSFITGSFYHELEILSRMPPHPNVVPAPVALCATNITSSDPLIFGFLLPFYTGGTVNQAIEKAPLPLRLSFAKQLVAAVHHLHSVAGTFHGDIKLENMILVSRASTRVILIDYEQGRLNDDAVAPELWGDWDVSLDKERSVEYVAYEGAKRKYSAAGHPDSNDEWRPFEAWKDFPEAIERAEVFAVGVALKKILLGMRDEASLGDSLVWTDEEGMPSILREVVDSCLATKPLERPRLAGLLEAFGAGT
ncbi:hypothetical protein P7C70_g4909, partial [Phenoliferia sp. Uapishka_3]